MKFRDLLCESLPSGWEEKLRAPYTLAQALEFAKQHAAELGRGASRAVFKIDDKRVVKIAASEGGIDSNRTELQMLRSPAVKQSGFAVPLLAYDDETNPVWLVTALTKPATDRLFQQVTGGPLVDLVNFVMDVTEPNDDIFAEPVRVQTSTNPDSEWVQSFYAFCQRIKHITPLGELGDMKNWGELNGKPVIIDLGSTYIVHGGLFKDAIEQL